MRGNLIRLSDVIVMARSNFTIKFRLRRRGPPVNQLEVLPVRRHRWPWTIGVTLTVGILTMVPTTNMWAASKLATPASLALSNLTMENSTTGWSFSGHQVFHTTDGGQRWTNVTPADVTHSAKIHQLIRVTSQFSSFQSAWVVSQTRFDTFVLSHTQNAGQHWTQKSFHLPGIETHFSLHQIDFTNALQGWIVLSPGAFGPAFPVQVWKTANGGTTWRLIYQNNAIGGAMSFNGLQNGWMVMQQFANTGRPLFALYHSTNAGHTWKSVSFKSVPNLDNLGSPTFTDQHGLLAVVGNFTAPSQYLAVLRSGDGGQHWGAMSPKLSALTTDYADVQTIGGHLAWALSSGKLWRSTNGGHAWTYQSADRFLAHAMGMNFLNAKVGWIWKTSPMGTTQLWETLSGGRHWTLNHPSVLNGSHSSPHTPS